jgi:predicted HicB family RNase H-like nuclease
MSQLTLDLPESLRAELERQAEREGVSLQHYIVYSLTRFVTAADVVAQRAAFEEMVTRYPQDQAEAALRDLLSFRQSS